MKYFLSKKFPIEFVVSENTEKKFDTHNHVAHYVISLIVEGEAEVERDKETIVCSTGDWFVIPPYIVHSIHMSKGCRMLTLCIGTTLVEEVSLEDPKGIVERFLHELHRKSMLDDVWMERFLCSISILYDLHKEKQMALEQDIAIVVSQMTDEAESEWKLEDLAKNVFVSKYHFLRKFKNCIGITPHQFHLQNKVRKSQKLLGSGNSVIDAAAQMGFYDQSHFNKAFSKVVGISPSEYVQSRSVL